MDENRAGRAGRPQQEAYYDPFNDAEEEEFEALEEEEIQMKVDAIVQSIRDGNTVVKIDFPVTGRQLLQVACAMRSKNNEDGSRFSLSITNASLLEHLQWLQQARRCLSHLSLASSGLSCQGLHDALRLFIQEQPEQQCDVSLDLQDNSLRVPDWSILRNYCSRIRVRRLDLSGCRYIVPDIQAILEGLVENPYIHWLDVSGYVDVYGSDGDDDRVLQIG